MSQALYRAVVGQVSPIYPNEDTPVPYRPTEQSRAAMRSSLPSELSESELNERRTIIENSAKNFPFPR